MTESIDPTAAIPITVASNALLGARELQERIVRELARRATAVRLEAKRFRLWLDAQHLDPNLVAQLIALAIYGVVSIAEAWAHVHRNR